MPSLRDRFISGTHILLWLQLLTSAIVLASWLSVVRVTKGLEEISAWRLSVLSFGATVREQYMHQAHSFVEGGVGHLDHYGQVVSDSVRRLRELEEIPIDEVGPIRDELRREHTAFSAWFEAEVSPRLESGLERREAVRLHEEAEEQMERIEGDITRLLDAVEGCQTREQERLKSALWRAVMASVVLAVVAAMLQFAIAQRLAGAVLEPIAGLSEAAMRFGRGDRSVRAPSIQDDELNTLAKSFNAMFLAVNEAEDRRVRAERLAVLGELSAAIAHELNNPLTVILGKTDDPTVRAEAEHATRVVRGLLGFARPGEEPEGSVDLATLAHEAVVRHGPWADARDLTLEFQNEGSLSVHTSPAGARQIIDNLLKNAIEASPPGSKIEVRVSRNVTSVLDRGAGLPPSLRHRLYEPFVTGRADGTGLGLAVCQRIARAQGGVITHEDRPGGGTVATWRPRRIE